MGIVISPESELGRELCRWEQHRTKYVGDGQQPGNPYVYRPYPRMLYKAHQQANGQYACMMPAPSLYEYGNDVAGYERAMLRKDTFDKMCQKIVADEGAERIAVGQGWALTSTEALEHAERHEQAIGNAAAEAAFAAQRMSANAKAELAHADTQTHAHVVDVKPARKRGRSVKGKPVAVSGASEEQG